MTENSIAYCPICKEQALLTDSHLRLFRCPCCTHAFTVGVLADPRLYSEEYFQERHKNWFNNQDYGLFRFFYNVLRRIIKQKKIKFLDVGCGKGGLLNYIKGLDPDIDLYGIDLAENNSVSFNFIKGDLLKENLTLQFEVVCANAMIEHVDDPRLLMKKLGDILAPQGLLLLSTINNLSFTYRIARFLNRFGIHAAYNQLYGEHHLQHYSNRSLRYLLQANGFQVLIQKNHNYPFKAVDIAETNPYIKKIYLLGVWFIFFLQALSGTGIAQLVICKKVAENNVEI